VKKNGGKSWKTSGKYEDLAGHQHTSLTNILKMAATT
jgi:hypothetical protein